MENISRFELPELIYGSREPAISSQITRLLKAGLIRKIAPRLYSSNLEAAPETIVSRNILAILGRLYPNTLLSHRSAFEFQPTQAGEIFVTTSYTRKVKLPGIQIRFIEGSPPVKGDNPLTGGLYASQKARALIENLQTSRKKEEASKCLPISELERILEQTLKVHGEQELNGLRDVARELASQLDMPREFERLNRMIGALLTTKPAGILKSPLARARAFGLPYDTERSALFETLFRELKKTELPRLPEGNPIPAAAANFAFFESYFSNYIEGTRFGIEEAKVIVRDMRPLPARNHDSHDILGTYRIVSDPRERSHTPDTPERLTEILLKRHSILLGSRTDRMPGRFKERNNFAGSTSFTDFTLVRGTLAAGFEWYKALDHPFAKAAYLHFVVSEVHPFLDGNGRMARIMMNAELTAGRLSRIIIPTVYREDYMGALRRLTRRTEPETYIRMLQRAYAFSCTVTHEDIDEMEAHLHACNAFSDDPDDVLNVVV